MSNVWPGFLGVITSDEAEWAVYKTDVGYDCACVPRFRCATLTQLVAHLKEHRAAGVSVPEYLLRPCKCRDPS